MTTQEIVVSYLTGAEVAINFTVYLLYGYSTSLVFMAISLFGYVGIHNINIAYLKTYILLSMILSCVRILSMNQQNYILLLIMNFYSISVCMSMSRYIKSVSEIVIGNPVQDEGTHIQIQNDQVGTEYKVASLI
jgi:hypothetical protein